VSALEQSLEITLEASLKSKQFRDEAHALRVILGKIDRLIEKRQDYEVEE
jgi:hypothetical protein